MAIQMIRGAPVTFTQLTFPARGGARQGRLHNLSSKHIWSCGGPSTSMMFVAALFCSRMNAARAAAAVSVPDGKSTEKRDLQYHTGAHGKMTRLSTMGVCLPSADEDDSLCHMSKKKKDKGV
jgi:hypothetical protein